MEKKNTFWTEMARPVVVLVVICLVASALLGFTNAKTAPVIEENIRIEAEKTRKEVLPAASEFTELEVSEELKANGVTGIFEGDNGTGYVVTAEKTGYGGAVVVTVGFDTEGKLLNYSVLQHSETPGLGAKMQEWFRADKNHQSVLGRKLADGELKVSKDGGDVDAITAATISSRAFLNAVNRAYSAFSGADGLTGATTSSDNTTKEGGNENE